MQFQVRESDDSCQPGGQYRNPRVVVQEHHGAPLLNCSGLVLVRQLIERLGVASAIDAGVRMLRRCRWYRESDHILTLIYSMLSGGSKLQDVNRLGQDDALKRVLGSERIPHATTIGKFLWRFGATSAHWARDVAWVMSRRFDLAGRDRPLVDLAMAGCDREVWKPLLLFHMTRDEFLVRDFLVYWLYPQFANRAGAWQPGELD